MGSNHSQARKLTVENEDPTSVIKVSDDVVQRIRGCQEVRKQQQQQPSVWPAGQSIPQAVPAPFYYEPSLTSIQLRQENVKNLKENDDYWANRIRNLETSHKKIHEIMDMEYKKAYDEIISKRHTEIKEIPCQEKKTAIIKCFKENKCNPMQCSKLVKEFQNCVESKRIEILTNKSCSLKN